MSTSKAATITRRVIAIVLIIAAILTLPASFYLDKLNLLNRNGGGGIGSLIGGADEIDMSEFSNLTYVEGGYGLPSGKVYSDKNVINILLLGTDEHTNHYNENARSDSMIVASVDTKKNTIKLVSFERATGVPILDGEYKGQWDWLTHAFRYGGADLVVKEIQTAYLLDVQYYVRVNIAMLVKLIDVVGGVDITITQAEADYINSAKGLSTANDVGRGSELQTVSTGTVHMNGVTAMVYARCRDIDSDWGRMGRQRTVIQAAVSKMTTLNTKQLNKMLNTILPMVQTNLSTKTITSLMLQAPGVLSAGNEIETITMPQDGTYGSMKGMEGRSLFAVDFTRNSKDLKKFLYGVE